MSEVIFHIAPKMRPWHLREREATLYSQVIRNQNQHYVIVLICSVAYFEERHEESVSQLWSGTDFSRNISDMFFFFTFSIQSLVFFSSFSLLHPFPRVIFSLHSPISLCVYLTQLSFNCHSGNQSFKMSFASSHQWSFNDLEKMHGPWLASTHPVFSPLHMASLWKQSITALDRHTYSKK